MHCRITELVGMAEKPFQTQWIACATFPRALLDARPPRKAGFPLVISVILTGATSDFLRDACTIFLVA
jgi:hypothetical protein